MKKYFVAPAAIVLSIGLLSACNPLSLLGPIEAVDPLRLAGQEVTGTITDTEPVLEKASTQLATKATGDDTYVTLSKYPKFDDPKDLPATPNNLNLVLSFTRIKFAGANCNISTLPDTINGQLYYLSATLNDAKARTGASDTSSSVFFVLTKQEAGVYSFSTTTNKFDRALSGIADVLGNKISPNYGALTLWLRFKGYKTLSGCDSTWTFGSAKSSFQF